jgi:hypothetical protein
MARVTRNARAGHIGAPVTSPDSGTRYFLRLLLATPVATTSRHYFPRLLFASAADHLKVRDRHVAVLGGILRDTVFFGLGLGIFFDSVQSRVGYSSGDRHRVPEVLSEVQAVALDFPGAAVPAGHLILISVFLHAPGYRTGILVRFFLRFSLCPQAAGHKGDSKRCSSDFEFHVASHAILNLHTPP